MKITMAPSVKVNAGQSANAVHSAVSIEHPYDDLTLSEAMDLMKRALLA